MINFLKRAYLAARDVLARYPAATAALVNIGVVLAGYFGLHIDASQLVYLAGVVAALVGAYVHARVSPVKWPPRQ